MSVNQKLIKKTRECKLYILERMGKRCLYFKIKVDNRKTK
jgi:hypothetical protein